MDKKPEERKHSTDSDQENVKNPPKDKLKA